MTDMTIDRRAVLRRAALAAPALLFAPACSSGAAAAGDGDAVSLPTFRQPDDPDDSAALARAFATNRPVHAPAGGGSGRGGRYQIANGGDANLPSGATLFGDGRDRTIIARSDVRNLPFILHCDSRSPKLARNIEGLRFRDLTFEDDVVGRGFQEYSYLVMLNGVSDAAFERVGFRGFRGDGLHLGASVISKTERHNSDVVVRDCAFDGINSNNRNAISVIDCDRLLVENSSFVNCTRTGNGTPGPGDPMNPLTGVAMPGPIDLEPNGDSFAIIRDIVIRANRFTGGGGYAVALHLIPNESVTIPQQRITIEKNVIEDRFGGIEALGFVGGAAATSRKGYAIAMNGNTVRRCFKPFIINGIRGATMTGNSFSDCTDRAELGYDATIADVTLRSNVFERIGGKIAGFGLWIRDSQGILLDRNRFVDCGTPGTSSGTAIALVGGVSRGLKMSGNVFTAPTGRMAQAIAIFRDARVDRASLSLSGNDLRITATPIATVLGAAAQ